MKKKKILKKTSYKPEVWAILGLILLFAVAWLGQKREPEVLTRKSDTERNYESLLPRIAKGEVRKGLVPVHIWKEENGKRSWHCTGLWIEKYGEVLTCGHAFWKLPGEKRGPAFYYFQRLQPSEKVFNPICEIREIINLGPNGESASKDAMVCRPGPKTLIHTIPNKESVDDRLELEFKFNRYKTSIKAVSTVTGESVSILGVTRQESALTFALIAYNAFPGESGTVFIGEDGYLYILGKVTPINDSLRKLFGLTKEYQTVSLCSMISIN